MSFGFDDFQCGLYACEVCETEHFTFPCKFELCSQNEGTVFEIFDFVQRNGVKQILWIALHIHIVKRKCVFFYSKQYHAMFSARKICGGGTKGSFTIIANTELI